jgi:cytochrome c556
MLNIRTLFMLSAVLLTACGGEPEDTHPGQAVAHRRAAFKELIKNFEPMGVMVRTDSYNAAKFQSFANSVMALRDAPWQYFKPDTQYPPSHSKDEVWSQPDQFEADRKAFYEATDKLAAIVGTPDEKVAAKAFNAVQETCKNCHKRFKRD